MESIYWVISRDCNQRCPHCYNDSEPGAPGLSREQALNCIEHFPDPDEVTVGRIILSGGEVLVWPELLLAALDGLDARFGERTQLWVQTNGDLLDESMLDRLLAANVRRIDVASMDQYHIKGTLQRHPVLETLLQSRGMVPADRDTTDSHGRPDPTRLTYAFWGATEDEWIGPLWPRGRAHQKKLS
ncbi:MAG: radical SAM protein, partial [Planctomycetaceae bacterium]